jgi:hypothetical protein
VTSSRGQEVVGDADWDLFEVVDADAPGDEAVCVDQLADGGATESKEEAGSWHKSGFQVNPRFEA